MTESATMASDAIYSVESLLAPIVEVNQLISIQQQSKDERATDFAEQLSKVKDILNKHGLSSAAALDNRFDFCQHNDDMEYCSMSTFVQGCLAMLENLKLHLTELVQNNMPCMSVLQEQDISILLHFVVNVGLVRHFDFQVTLCAEQLENRPPCRYRDLKASVCALISLCDCEVLRGVIFPKHLLHVLGALLMLCYSPICRKLVSKDHRMLLLSKLTVLITKWCKLHDVAFYLLVLQGSNKRTSPAWLQQHCGHILSKCILRKGGVSEVATAIIKSLDSEMSDWQKSEIISGILTTPSRSSPSTGSYCSTICQQILEILESYTACTTKQCDNELLMQILISSIFLFYKKFSNDTQEFFLDPILQSIKQISLTNSGPLSADSTPKFGLTTSINIVHLILTQFKHPDKETMIKEVFVPYLPVLFHLFSWARNNWSPIAKQLSEIIEECLVESSNCTLTAKIFLVVCYVLETNCVETSVPLIFPKEGTDYMVTQDGECMATHREVNLMSPEAVIASQDRVVEAFTDIMQHCTKIASEVLILLIQRLGDSNVITSQDNSLLAPEERAALHLKKGASHLLTFALVTSLCETLNPSDLLSDVASICHFAEVMMINSCTNAIEMEDSHRDNIKLCIAILGLCLLTELDSKQKESLNNLLPVLQKVKEQDHLSSTYKETVEDLMIAIATHSSSNFDIEKFSKALQDQSRLMESAYQQKASAAKKVKSTTPVKRPLIEDITETKTYPKNLTTDEKLIESINEAFESIHDSSPPIKAAAIRFLSKHLKHPTLTNGKDKVYELFLETLQDEDSFVYLSAVQGISLLVCSSTYKFDQKKSATLLERLIMKLDEKLCSTGGEEGVVLLGEVIVRVIKQLGDLAPHVGKTLIPLFLRSSRDQRSSVRASCFSNLAELCPLLRHTLSSFQYELAECLCATASSDTDATVRSGSVYVMFRIFEAFQYEILEMLPDTIGRYYTTLKKVVESDVSEVTTRHARLALDRIADAMRGTMFPNPDKYQKQHKITILPKQ